MNPEPDPKLKVTRPWAKINRILVRQLMPLEIPHPLNNQRNHPRPAPHADAAKSAAMESGRSVPAVKGSAFPVHTMIRMPMPGPRPSRVGE
ncbi:hypothetical protein E4U43_001260 [Claviceps pusilla]|uniref:Uncharacterized protein n=1 Tax=Claviceps pusilla TaxID=123648 RepID=A0A9P7SZB0_9HYPO|nr:hypothetical protein E4U43_001260 [Claviceps pusilla]